MKNSEIWGKYDFYTGELTKHARYLGFAGIAICWLFKTPDVTFPPIILGALGVLVVFFLLDLAQYYVAARRLKTWMENEEQERGQSGEGLAGDYWPPRSLDRPAFLLFRVKLLVLLLGFTLIGIELIARMRSNGGTFG